MVWCHLARELAGDPARERYRGTTFQIGTENYKRWKLYVENTFSKFTYYRFIDYKKKWKWDKSTKKMSQCCLCMLISSRQKDSIAIRSNHYIHV